MSPFIEPRHEPIGNTFLESGRPLGQYGMRRHSFSHAACNHEAVDKSRLCASGLSARIGTAVNTSDARCVGRAPMAATGASYPTTPFPMAAAHHPIHMTAAPVSVPAPCMPGESIVSPYVAMPNPAAALLAQANGIVATAATFAAQANGLAAAVAAQAQQEQQKHMQLQIQMQLQQQHQHRQQQLLQQQAQWHKNLSGLEGQQQPPQTPEAHWQQQAVQEPKIAETVEPQRQSQQPQEPKTADTVEPEQQPQQQQQSQPLQTTEPRKRGGHRRGCKGRGVGAGSAVVGDVQPPVEQKQQQVAPSRNTANQQPREDMVRELLMTGSSALARAATIAKEMRR